MGPQGIGHNSQSVSFEIEVRLFNSIARHAGPDGRLRRLTVQAGATVGEIVDLLRIPRQALHLILVNGRDITPGLVGDAVRTVHPLEAGDVVALSGPVPYSYGYGAPVV